TSLFIRINDRCLDNRRSAGNGADNHELFRQRRALYVAVVRMLDHFCNDDDSARRRFARKKCNAARDPRRNRTARARRESGAAVADRASRSIVARPDRTRCAPTFAWAAFGERGSGGNTRPPRNGSLRERSHRSRSDHRHRATTRFDWRGLWPGARFFPSRLEFRRIRYASDRARHCRSVECNCLWTFDRGTDLDRLQLFLEKGGSDVGRNGNACRRVNQQMLLWALLARRDVDSISATGIGTDAGASGVTVRRILRYELRRPQTQSAHHHYS